MPEHPAYWATHEDREQAVAMRLARAPAALLLVAAAFIPVRPSAADEVPPAAPPPAEAFGALPANTDVVLSPSGTRLAWVDHEHD